MKRVLLTTAAVWAVAFPALAQQGAQPAAPKWDVSNPIGALRVVRINVDEGTWMAVDVSPDDCLQLSHGSNRSRAVLPIDGTRIEPEGLSNFLDHLNVVPIVGGIDEIRQRP